VVTVGKERDSSFTHSGMVPRKIGRSGDTTRTQSSTVVAKGGVVEDRGTRPAYVRKGQEKVRVPVTVPPKIDENGYLIIGIQEAEGLFNPKETLRWTLIATPKGQPVEIKASEEKRVGKQKLVKFKLPPELLQEWQGIENWDWRWLPFRFLVEVAKDAPEKGLNPTP
jgi:hypothetical protein